MMQERRAKYVDIRGPTSAEDASKVGTAGFMVPQEELEVGLSLFDDPPSLKSVFRPINVDKTRDVSAPSGIFHALKNTPTTITIEHEAAMIGDTLNTLPFIMSLIEALGHPVHLAGKFHPAVRALVSDLPLTFGEPPASVTTLAFNLNVKANFQRIGPLKLHASQGYFAEAGLAFPELPIRLPLCVEQCGLTPGFVISPFCGSEPQVSERHIRVWFADRWRRVMEFLLTHKPDCNIYVVGGPKDDPTWSRPSMWWKLRCRLRWPRIMRRRWKSGWQLPPSAAV